MMFPFRVFPRIYLALAFVLGVVVFGSVGYVVVEGYSWVEALYMTVITVSTVGFGEVRELSDGGMLFTTVLIMGSIGTCWSFLETPPETRSWRTLESPKPSP